MGSSDARQRRQRRCRDPLHPRVPRRGRATARLRARVARWDQLDRWPGRPGVLAHRRRSSKHRRTLYCDGAESPPRSRPRTRPDRSQHASEEFDTAGTIGESQRTAIFRRRARDTRLAAADVHPSRHRPRQEPVAGAPHRLNRSERDRVHMSGTQINPMQTSAQGESVRDRRPRAEAFKAWGERLASRCCPR